MRGVLWRLRLAVATNPLSWRMSFPKKYITGK